MEMHTIKTLQKYKSSAVKCISRIKGGSRSLLNMIGKKYFIEQYSFAWEAFWLITPVYTASAV